MDDTERIAELKSILTEAHKALLGDYSTMSVALLALRLNKLEDAQKRDQLKIFELQRKNIKLQQELDNLLAGLKKRFKDVDTSIEELKEK